MRLARLLVLGVVLIACSAAPLGLHSPDPTTTRVIQGTPFATTTRLPVSPVPSNTTVPTGIPQPTATPLPPTPTLPPTATPVPTATATAVPGLSTDKFVGPFASWANVKNAYGAVGNCVADDTAAFQAAENDLGTPGHAAVLWVPAGCYKIANTLTMATRINISIIGEDPATTTLKWFGPGGGIIQNLDGVANSRFDRLTFDGQTTANVLVDQAYSGGHNYFDTTNEYADDVFQNAGFGIRGGWLGHGFSEVSILRDHFLHNTTAGVSLGNFNALDVWVWDCLFDSNNVGVTNQQNNLAGNFNVYDSVFLHSTVADLSFGNTGGFNARGNWSLGSARFFQGGGSANPANVTIQGNTILDPGIPDTISMSNLGPIMLIDNVVRSQTAVTTGVVRVGSFAATDVFAIGNTFTMTNPIQIVFNGGRLHEIGTTIVTPASLAGITQPTLPGVLPNNHRAVFDVPAGSNDVAIQTAINSAVAAGNQAVVHLANGDDPIRAMLTVPANAPIQIVGDGGASRLVWTNGVAPATVLQLAGPSKVTLRDFQIEGSNYGAAGITITNADQVGARIALVNAVLTQPQTTNLWVDRLDHALVQLEDFNHSASGGTSIRIDGGPLAAAGNWAGGQTNILAGASGGNVVSYDVTNGAHAVIRDIWFEQGGPGFLHLSGPSTVTFAGGKVASIAGSPPAFDIASQVGQVTLLTDDLSHDVVISGNGSATRVLGIGLLGADGAGYIQNTSNPPATALFLNSARQGIAGENGSVQIPEQGTYDPTFIRTMLAQARAVQPVVLRDLPAGVTDVRILRVGVDQATTGVHITP